MRLTREGYEQKLIQIKDLQEKLKSWSSGSIVNTRYSTDSEDRFTNENIALYKSILARELLELESAEIIKELDLGENICSVGDEVTFLMHYSDSEPIEVTKKLTDIPSSSNDVSIDSPVGKAIFGKGIGTLSEVKTPAGVMSIYIISKTSSRNR